MSDLITVIIPAYQVEKYVEKCVLSITGQTYTNLQILLIDDGSTDGTAAICDSLASSDKRITVIHQENRGLAMARNIGLELSEGRYVYFIDSDDYAEPELLEKSHEAAVTENAQIVFCNYDSVDEDGTVLSQSHWNEGYKVFTSDDLLYRLCRGWTFGLVTWNKLYRSDVLKDFRFENVRKFEDSCSIYKIYCNTEKAVVLRDVGIHYLKRKGSLINSAFKLSDLKAIEYIIERSAFLYERGLNVYAVMSLADAANCLYENMDAGRDDSQIRAEQKRLRKIIIKKYKEYDRRGVKFFFRVALWSFSVSMKLFALLKSAYSLMR